MRWLPAVLLLGLPKCLGCLPAYVALIAGLGLGGPELCGDIPAGFPFGAIIPIVLIGFAGTILWWRRRNHLLNPPCPCPATSTDSSSR